MKNVLTFPDGCAYDGHVAGDQRPGLEPRVRAARSRDAFVSKRLFSCHGSSSMGDRAGGAARLAGALPVVPTLVRSPTIIGTVVGGSLPQLEHTAMTTSTTGASAPAVFNFQSLDVRVFADGSGEPWLFCAADVCAVLGYRNDSDAIAKHCRQSGVAKRDLSSGGQMREMAFINEGNLYRLIIKSRKPEAQVFEREVMEVILPAIRKTGHYALTPYTANAGDTLTAEEADLLRSMLRDAVSAGQSTKRAAFMISGWSKLKTHFGVSYRSIPRQEFEEAISIVARHIAESTTTESHSVASPHALPHPSFRNRRWLITFDRDGNERATPIGPEDFLTNLSDLPDQIRDSGFLATADELLEIIKAFADRLSDKAAGSTRRSA